MALGDADLPFMLEELGEPIVLQISGQPQTWGIVDRQEEESIGESGIGRVQGRSVTVTIRSGTFGANLRSGSTLTINGLIYKAARVYEVDDGALTRIEAIEQA